MNNVEIIQNDEFAVAIFPSQYSENVKKLLDLLQMPEYTPNDLIRVKFVSFVKWEPLDGSGGNRLLNMVRDLRESCRVLGMSPRHHFRASLKECKEFIKDGTLIYIPVGFLKIIREIGIEVEEV